MVWVADGEVGDSVRQIVELDREISSISTRLDAHKSVVKRFANEMFSRLRLLLLLGVLVL